MEQAITRGKKQAIAQGQDPDYALHTIGWKAFQDLCADVLREIFSRSVEIYSPTRDGGRDAYLIGRPRPNESKSIPWTVQCKHFSKADKALSLRDVQREQEAIVRLQAAGFAQGYIIMTNASVSGVAAEKIKEWLKGLGVAEAHIYGKEWFSSTIRTHSRLRALVPRVYGLGDLSWILDERRIEQARYVLSSLRDELRVYVPTEAHRKAVDALLKHRFVLLLGAPASGKSTIAAILAAIALDHEARDVIRVDGPSDIVEHWNPAEENRFFWVDDAFGANQYSPRYVEEWNKILPTIKAALNAGNRFVLTSRDYIWNRAKEELRCGNLPALHSGQVVIDLAEISPEERQQILYNHIKYGDQSKAWKRNVKPFLQEVALHPNFLPETARRLGLQAFTRNLGASKSALLEFVAEPKEWLIQTIQQLEISDQVAIALVFLHGGKVPSPIPDDERLELVRKYIGVEKNRIRQSFQHLRGSFLVDIEEPSGLVWRFKHPTISDAYSSIIARQPEFVELYVAGARLKTILSEVTYGSSQSYGSTVRVPENLAAKLSDRLASAAGNEDMDRRIASFLIYRTDDSFLRLHLTRDPGFLRRLKVSHFIPVTSDPVINLLGRANALGLLDEDVRNRVANYLHNLLTLNLDASFLDDEDSLGLIKPTDILKISLELKSEYLMQVEHEIDAISENICPDESPEGAYEVLETSLGKIADLFSSDPSVQELIASHRRAIAKKIRELNERQQPWDEDEPDYVRPSVTQPSKSSLFDDVDE